MEFYGPTHFVTLVLRTANWDVFRHVCRVHLCGGVVRIFGRRWCRLCCFCQGLYVLLGAIVSVDIVVTVYTWAWDSHTFVWRHHWYVVPAVVTFMAIAIFVIIIFYSQEIQIITLKSREFLEIRHHSMFISRSYFFPLVELRSVRLCMKYVSPHWIEIEYGPQRNVFL
eukprot:TRINITY_DN2529_c4_g1_i1.p1 TRINITY_DN2529_c4_g1~~TRINITY_DN2529_c4_g1_i1.p1  ORF type:complete len:168 (+),score=13.71 TRINITY_DN2529_c4_g1_i1:859-1362(+)